MKLETQLRLQMCLARIKRGHEKQEYLLFAHPELADNGCQAQSILMHREHWAAELAKQIAAQPQAMRAFVEKPGSDVALLEALTASITASTAATPQGEDLFSAPPARAAEVATTTASSRGEGQKTKTVTNTWKYTNKKLF